MAKMSENKIDITNPTENQESDITKQEAQTALETERTRTRKVFIPRTDIYEREDALVVVADMPGVDENAVDIQVERRVLTITGRVAPERFDPYRLEYGEYEIGDYERSFSLSDEVDVNKIQATVKQGILRIELPKAEAAKPKKITVQAG